MIVRPVHARLQYDIAKRCGVILTKNGVEVILWRTVDDVTLFELMDDHPSNKLNEIQEEECYSNILSSVTSVRFEPEVMGAKQSKTHVVLSGSHCSHILQLGLKIYTESEARDNQEASQGLNRSMHVKPEGIKGTIAANDGA